jgi:general secretion pathway protein B
VSFILEALRKSESDRQRLGNVALADLPVARRHRGQPWWVLALGGLMLLNLLVLALVLTRNPATPALVANTAPAPANVQPSNAPVTAQPLAITPAPIASNPLQAATAQIEYETVPASELDIANAAASVPAGETFVRPSDAFRSDANRRVTATDSTTADASASQNLHVDLHVYSKNANERFVLINMRRYTEGQQLPNGATVEQITPQGVVIQQNGTRYQLDRQ